MEYKGYKIVREEIGRYGTSFQYRCGKYIAPRKKDIKQHIDNLLDKKMMLDIELELLQKI
jgi:hypothetical protein